MADSDTVVGASALPSDSVNPPAGAPGSGRGRDRRALVLAAGAGAAVVLVAGGLFLAFSGGGDSVVATDPSTAPSAVSSAPVAVSTPQATVTATVAAPGPESTVYVERTQTVAVPPSSTPNFSGAWKARPMEGSTTFLVDLDLTQGPAGTVSGTMTSTNNDQGTTGSWNLSGRVNGDSVTLTPGSWIRQPDSGWARDTVIVTKTATGYTAAFFDPRKPAAPWGTSTLS